MHFVWEDIDIVKESRMKILFLEKSMTVIMEQLDVMVAEIRENSNRFSSNERRKPKNSNDDFGVGSSEPPLVVYRVREVHDNGDKGEICTRLVEMPIFYGGDPK